MPFQISDVDKHNKGLSPNQKQVWVKVANDVLKRCAERKDIKDCDGRAISRANGVVAKNLDFEDYWDVICKYPLTKDPNSFKEGLEIRKIYKISKTFDNFEDALKAYKIAQTFNINNVEIFSAGEWNGDKYTEHDLDEMIDAFDQVGFEPPLKLGHNKKQEDGQPKFGGIQAIRRQGTKLLADFFNIPLKLYEALQRKNFERVSSEIYWDYSSNGRVFPRVLKAVAFLGADIPAVTDLESIGNLYEDANNKDFRVYEFPKNLKREGNKMSDAATIAKHEQEIKELKKDAEAKDKDYNIGKKEIEKLKADNKEKDEAKKKAEAKLSEQEAEAKVVKVENFIKEMKGKGKILPKFEKELKTLMSNAPDSEKHYCYTETDKKTGEETKHEFSQLELITRIFENMPKLVHFSELSSKDGVFENEDYADDPGKEVDTRTKAYMEKNKEKDYSIAMDAVLNADKGLKDAYVKGGK